MKKNLIYIFSLVLLFLISSCALEEKNSDNVQGRVEFVARATYYDEHNVSTKLTTNEISALENNVYTAFFLLFDKNDNLVSYTDLTNDISNNTIPHQVITPDYSLSSARACFLINVPSSYASSIEKVSDLSTQPIDLSYAKPVDTDCIGVPVLSYTKNNTALTAYCIPMFGISEAQNFSDVKGSTMPIEISLKRLLAKVQMNISVAISGSSNAAFTLNSVIVNNMPKKVIPYNSLDANGRTKWAVQTNDNKSDYLVVDNVHNYGFGEQTIFFYVPEHILGNVGTVTDQKNKPTLVTNKTTAYKPIYVAINGELSAVGANSANYDATYNIYLGENNKDNFDLTRNKCYVNNITIEGTNSDDARVDIEALASYENLIGDNDDESANCYIITGANKSYILPAYKGAVKGLSNAEMCSGFPHIIWNDSPNTITLKHTDKQDSRILFEVKNGTATTVQPGNALLAIKDAEGKILWSWHIWFCESAPGEHTYSDNNVMMDRNLGAKSQTKIGLGSLSTDLFYNDGLYYQYGRKDPLTLDAYKYNQSTIKAYSADNLTSKNISTTEQPTVFDKDWSFTGNWTSNFNGKGESDPCPKGYKVPSLNTWTKTKDDFNRVDANDYVFIYNWLSPSVAYPYLGYLDEGGNMKTDVIGSFVSEEQDYDAPLSSIAGDYIEYGSQSGTGSAPTNTKPYRFEKVKYKIVDKTVLGYLWALKDSDKNTLNFGYEEKGIIIVSYGKRIGTWKETGILSWKVYTAKYETKDDIYEEHKGDSALSQDEKDKIFDDILTSIRYNKVISGVTNGNFNLDEFLEDIVSMWTEGIVFEKVNSDPKHGKNVRCLKEQIHDQIVN